jgi:bacterial/archaeal transporter family-2 protein
VRRGAAVLRRDQGRRVTGQALSDKAVARLVKQAAACGLDPARYSGHSLRAGLATAAGDQGAGLPELMRMALLSRRGRMAWAYVALAVAAGAMLPLQAAINARLARLVGSPLWAAGISGAVLTLALVLVAIPVLRAGPRIEGLGGTPWWAWTGGLCGAMVLSATTATAPRLGTASMIALIMAGQVLCSLLLDHYGLLGLAIQPVTAKRAVAAAFLLAGAALMR